MVDASAVGQMRLPEDHLPTPALLVDLDLFDANVAAMERLLAGTSKRLRPHIKTHRTPALALRQLGGSASGVTCSTVGEAEAMAAAGILDLLVANEVVDPGKVERLVTLAGHARVQVAADSAQGVEALGAAAQRNGRAIEVLIDVDVLIHRCGVGSPAEAVALATRVARTPGLRVVGAMGYEGRVRAGVPDRAARIASAYDTLARTVAALRDAGVPVDTVSGAGTSTLREAIADPTITELQAGVYAVMEPELEPMGLPFACAVAVRGTVISARDGRIVLDAGRRSVGMEYGPPLPLGLTARSIMVSDEHTTIWVDGPTQAVGDQVDLVPGQVRTTFNLHDEVVASRAGAVVATWPIAARGTSR
jgi:D-serine deaminase-like pyridoxal phosphate-dependent protein